MRNTPIIVAWQESDLGALGLTAAQCSEAVQWVSADRQKKLSGHFAIAQLVRDSGEWWRFLGTVMKFPIASPIAAYIYKKIANSRRCAVRSTP
jgi:predicted DCC family thiol-disulfide oxidoreductase YuxK